jgi:hypothetical protein
MRMNVTMNAPTALFRCPALAVPVPHPLSLPLSAYKPNEVIIELID